jgi:UDP-N-acetylglucosamine--N-acetylmuramyl-(pentapeptide) pyrophosphoryl-undecaprenol N-acetylglucosamine transferase
MITIKNKIVICGGHFSPAIALIEFLKEYKQYEVFYFGRKYSFEGDKSLSLEFREIRSLAIPFYIIITGRLQRSWTVNSLSSICKFPIGLFQSIYYLLQIKPKIVISFGGYVALPVCIASWILKIPVITHEQTRILGLSNRIISRISQILCLSWQDTKYIPSNIKSIVTGNLIRQSLFDVNKINDITSFGCSSNPLIYITGGSSGSQSINKVILEIIPKIIQKFRIIHQCGSADNFADYKLLTKMRNSLGKEKRINYQIFPYIKQNQVGKILKESTLIISRSGANTLSEIMINRKPAILIPLPWAADDEQSRNADKLVRIGAAVVIKQAELTPDLLTQTIIRVFAKKEKMISSYNKISYQDTQNTQSKFKDIIDKIIKNNEF